MTDSYRAMRSPGSTEVAETRGGRRVLRTTLAVLATGGLAAAAFGVADAAASGSGSAARPQAGAALASASTKKSTSTGTHKGWGRRALRHLAGRGAGEGFGGAMLGKVTATASGSVTVATAERGTKTVDTTTSTKYFTMLTKASSSAVTAGDEVAVLLERPASTSGSDSSSASSDPTASAIVVIEPFALGTVVSASSSEIVLTSNGGLDRDILVGSAAYHEGGSTISSSDVKAGQELFAYGEAASDPTELQASQVYVVGPRTSGIVSSVSGSTIKITSPGGTESIETSASTRVRNGKKASAVSDVAKGDILTAIGTKTAKTSFAATVVTFEAAPKKSASAKSGAWKGAFRGSATAGFGAMSAGFGSGLSGASGLSALAGLGNGNLGALISSLLG